MFYEEFYSNLKESIIEYLETGNDNVILKIIDTQKRKTHENDLKMSVDTVIPDILLNNLVTESEISYFKLKRLLDLSIILAKREYCSTNLSIFFLSELFDCRTLNECEELFCFIDQNIQTWKEEFFFKNVKNHLLRTCNDLLRRLSRNQNTVFCGRILIFLANFFPLFERSGLNLTSEFNQDNSTNYSYHDFNENSLSEANEDNEKKVEIKVDIDFYKKFWQLQEYFRNPIICYSKNNFKVFQNNCDQVLSVFSGYKIDPNSSCYFQTLGLDSNDEKNIFFVKYLTNQKLLELQLSDSNFRRHILIQVLIIFQYLTSNVKFRVLESANLTEEQSNWINDTKKKVNQLIEETPPNGLEVQKVVEHILERETSWNSWKNEGCAEIKEIADPEDIIDRTKNYISSTYASHKKARIGDLLRNANNSNKILIGNNEMNRLWNFCSDNMEACKSHKRIFAPTISQYFEPTLKAITVEERQMYCSDPNFCWKALRLLSQKSNYFFVPNNQVVKPVSDYLSGVIERLSKDYNISTPKSGGISNEEVKAETEDISDDELLKNVDSNSVKSNEEEVLDADNINNE